MKNRRISTLAIAGLTSLAVAISPVTAPNTSVLSAAVAQAQNSALSFTEGPATVKYNTPANFTVTVPNAETGSKVQFFLDNVPVATVSVSGGTAAARITPKSYGQHKVIARYVDPQGFNPRADINRTFTTAVDIQPIIKAGPYDGSDDEIYDSRFKSGSNLVTGTQAKPFVVQPGAAYTQQVTMKVVDAGTVTYEIGINPPAGATYVAGRRTDDTGKNIIRRGKADGTASLENGGGDSRSIWGTTGEVKYGAFYAFTWRGTAPKVNPGYVALDAYSTLGNLNRTFVIEGDFKAPTTPGLYLSQMGYFKFRTGPTHFLRLMDNGYIRVAEPKLPDRKQRTNSTVKVAANQKFVAKQAGNLEITVTPSNASGTVTVKHGDRVIVNGASVTGGKASIANVKFDEPGTPELTLEFTSTTPGVNNSTGKGNVTVVEPAATTTLELEVPKYAVVGDFTPLKAKVAPAAAGRIDFYDGETLIDGSDVDDEGNGSIDAVLENEGDRTIRAVFVPGDKEKFEGSEDTQTLKVYAEEPQAEVNEPEANTNPAPVVIGSEDPKPEDYIANAGDLPDGTKYEWKDKPDFTKEGEQDATVVVTYPDGSVDEVPVKVIVEKPKSSNPSTTSAAAPTTTSAATSTAPTTTTSAATSTAATSTTSTTTAASSATSTTTSGKATTTTSATSTAATTPRTTSGTKPTTTAAPTKPTATATNTTTATAVATTTATETKSDADTYNPKPISTVPTVSDGKLPAPAGLIANVDKLPGGTVVSWDQKPDLTKSGDNKGTIKIAYPDGTADQVEVTVPVKAVTTATATATATSTAGTKPTTGVQTTTATTSATAPTITTTTTSAQPSTTTEKQSSGSSQKEQNQGSSAPTWLKVLLGILFTVIGIGAGFFAWNQFGPK